MSREGEGIFHEIRQRRMLWGGALAFSVALVLLPWVVNLDGHPHADWEHFLGRFHMLALHLPIGLLLLIPVLEVGGARRPALREAAGFVLRLAFLSCLLALVLGYLLAHGSGAAGLVVTRHMAGAIALTVGTLLCVMVRPWWATVHTAYLYPMLLTGTLLAMVWTAHQGGMLTHGNNYLTQYMPEKMKRWCGLEAAPVAASFYARHVSPIFDSNCVSCHGAGQAKGGLRLDSYQSLMNGGQEGPVIFAGQPERSLLLMRVTLPQGHKQFMPAEGKPPLRPEQIGWIKAWIEQGASPKLEQLQGVSIGEDRAEAPLLPVGDYSALNAEIAQMAKGQGAKLIRVSAKPEDGLVLFTVDVSANFGDAQLAQFLKFAPYIVDAELGRTTVTDASFDTLKQFTHLRALHLEGTAITGSGLAKLGPLPELSYINLSGTAVSAEAAASLKSIKSLRHVYLYNTPAQPEKSAAPGAAKDKSAT